MNGIWTAGSLAVAREAARLTALRVLFLRRSGWEKGALRLEEETIAAICELLPHVTEGIQDWEGL